MTVLQVFGIKTIKVCRFTMSKVVNNVTDELSID
jgi:hypothetical protein